MRMRLSELENEWMDRDTISLGFLARALFLIAAILILILESMQEKQYV
jgi:hypothetical protein